MNYGDGLTNDWRSFGIRLLWTGAASVAIHLMLLILVVPGLRPVERRGAPQVYQVTVKSVALPSTSEAIQPPPPEKKPILKREKKPIEALTQLAIRKMEVQPVPQTPSPELPSPQDVEKKVDVETAPKPDLKPKEEEEKIVAPVPLPMTAAWAPDFTLETKKDQKAMPISDPAPTLSAEKKSSLSGSGEVKIQSTSARQIGPGPGDGQAGGAATGRLETGIGTGGGLGGAASAMAGPAREGGATGSGAGGGSGSGPRSASLPGFGSYGSGTGVGGAGTGGSGRGGSGSGASLERSVGSGGSGFGAARPSYAGNPTPVYPSEAKKKGYQGEVLLRVEVLSNGRVGQIEVKKSSTYEVLDRSAFDAVKKWKFIPGRKDGRDETVWVNIPIRFELR